MTKRTVLLLAIVMFVLEVKVTSYGLLTLGGTISLVIGSLMLIDGPIPALRAALAPRHCGNSSH